MSWTVATVRGLLIVAYLVTATVWLPNRALRLEPVATAPDAVRDLVVLSVWAVGLAAGMLLLRFGQRRGII
jgi:hypothetical protein